MGIVAAGSNGTVAGIVPKFATLDNFVMIAKFRYIAKSTVHSENFNFLYACIFLYDSEIHCA